MLNGGERLRMCGVNFDLSRCGRQAWLTKKVPRRLIWCIRSYFFIGVSRVPVRLIALALLIQTSMAPNASTAFCTASKTCSSLRMSHINGNALPPAASTSFAAL